MNPGRDLKQSDAHPWQRLLTLAILLLAAALRWADLGLVEYKYDEAHITGLALAVAQGGRTLAGLPLISGGTSLGIPRSAFDVYLLAAPLAFVRRPEAAVWMVGALGVAAVALTYALASQVGGRRVAWLAALYMAANPWLVLYDRKLWAHIQVLLSVGLLWVAWQVVVRRHPRTAFWFPVLAALQVLAHVLALVQILSWVAALLVAPRRWWQRWTAWGAAAAGVLLLPYLWGLAGWARTGLAVSGLPLSQALGELVVGSGDAAATDRWHSAWQVLGGAGIAGITGLESSARSWWRVSDWLAWLVLGLILIGLVRVATRLRNRAQSRRQGAVLLLAWLLGPVLALAVGPIAVYAQYWTVLLPLPALFFALGLDAVANVADRHHQRWPGGWRLAGVAAGLIVLTWVGGYVSMVQAVEAGAGAAAFGAPLARWQNVLTETRAWARQLGTDQVRVAVRGVDPGQQSDPAAVATLIGNPPFARFVAPASPPALLLADGRESLYLWTLQDAETETWLERLGDRVWEGTLAADLPPARLYRLPPASLADLRALSLDPPADFDAGLSLVGYRLPENARAGEPFEVTLVWKVLDLPERLSASRRGDFTAFNHVMEDATGERVAQSDGMSVLSRDWWPGDVLVQPYRLHLPAGSYRWRVGLYSQTDGSRAQLSTGGDAVDLGPFVVE